MPSQVISKTIHPFDNLPSHETSEPCDLRIRPTFSLKANRLFIAANETIT